MKYLALTLIVISSFIAKAQQGGKNFIDQNYIEVTATSKVTATPDIIYLQIIIDEVQSKGRSIDQMEKAMISALKKIDIDTKKQLSIKDFDSNFRKKWLKRQQISMSKSYQLKVNSGAVAGKVYDSLEKLGISNISVTRYDHSQIEQLKNKARVKAILAAKNKAKVLSEALNQSIGKAIFIQEYDMGNNWMKFKRANVVYSAEMGTSQAEPVEFEKIELNARVMVRFQLN